MEGYKNRSHYYYEFLRLTEIMSFFIQRHSHKLKNSHFVGKKSSVEE